MHKGDDPITHKNGQKDNSTSSEIKQDLCICNIIPAFTEEFTIGSVILRTKHFIVDNGSIDQTYEISCLASARTIRPEKNKEKVHTLAGKYRCNTAFMPDDDRQHILITETGGGELYL